MMVGYVNFTNWKTMNIFLISFCIGMVFPVLCQGQGESLPKFTVTYLAMYEDPLQGPLNMSCRLFYGARVWMSFEHAKKTLVDACPPGIEVMVEKNTDVTFAEHRLNYTTSVDIYPTSNENPADTRKHLQSCIDGINGKFANLAELDKIMGVNFEEVLGKDECQSLTMDPYEVIGKSVVFVPGQTSPMTTQSGPDKMTGPDSPDRRTTPHSPENISSAISLCSEYLIFLIVVYFTLEHVGDISHIFFP